MCKVVNMMVVVGILAFLGCKTGTTTPSAGTGGTTPNTPAGAGAITPENTTITWIGTKPNGKHEGGFKSFSGSIKPITDKFDDSTITVDIDTDSLFSDDPKLTTHLKTPDFFDVKKFPKASFVSKGISALKAKQGEPDFAISGDLTLHGTTKNIDIRVLRTLTDEHLTLEGTFTIDRTDYGIAFDPAKVDKDVKITLKVKVARK
jgi:polyisoprenoid-binding protein YceI